MSGAAFALKNKRKKDQAAAEQRLGTGFARPFAPEPIRSTGHNDSGLEQEDDGDSVGRYRGLVIVGTLCLGAGSIILVVGAIIGTASGNNTKGTASGINTIGYIFVGMGFCVLIMRCFLACFHRTGNKQDNKISSVETNLVLEDVHTIYEEKVTGDQHEEGPDQHDPRVGPESGHI